MQAEELYRDEGGWARTGDVRRIIASDRYEAQANLIQQLRREGVDPAITPDAEYIETSLGTVWRLVFDK